MNAITRDGSGIIAVLLIFPLLVAIILSVIMLRSARKKGLLYEWAQRQGLRLLKCEERWARLGPPTYKPSKIQRVYQVTVQHPDGHIATGWLQCAGLVPAPESLVTVVRWDDPKPERPMAPGFPVLLHDSQSNRPSQRK